MTQAEFKKLQQAEKLIGQQKKLDLQIENLKNCRSLTMAYTNGRDQQKYYIDIQAKDFTGDNIMEWKAKEFIDGYVNYLECKKIELQEAFDNL